MKPIPDSVSDKLDKLHGTIKTHIEIAQLCVEADDGNVFFADLWINAAIKRSIQLVDGFVVMVRKRNVSCAGALLRLQIDTALRLFACFQVNTNDYVVRALKGERLDKFKDQNGIKLTDAHLVDELSKTRSDFRWLKGVYQQTSGFVHMSGLHIFAIAEVRGEMTLSQEITLFDDRWSEAHLIEAIDTFGAATDIVIWLVVQWFNRKVREPGERLVASEDTSFQPPRQRG